MENTKVIADPIHGMMEFEDYLVKIIDTPYFQRLRLVKQLGGVEYVYPGGSHSRFGHSLGVCHLAGRLLDNLEKRGTEIKKHDRKCVLIAALCHDIGHGPFSHLYEAIASDLERKEEWKHEPKSVEITEFILQELKDKINLEDHEKSVEKIKDMIKGKLVEDLVEQAPSVEEVFLYQIVNNKNSGVDVDKWDYFIRDSHACGFSSNFDLERALLMVRTCKRRITKDGALYKPNVLSFRDKDDINLYNMFQLRYTLHKKVCKHPVTLCVEEMIADALKYSDKEEILKHNGKSISMECCRKGEIKQYCLIDDTVLQLIYHLDGQTENLQKARKLVERIHCRDFYFCIYETQLQVIPEPEEIEDVENKVNTALKDRIPQADTEKQFRVKVKKINYGNKDKDPVPKVYFYKKGKFSIEPVEVYVPPSTPMIPKCFEEITLKVFCTVSKKSCIDVDWDSARQRIKGILKDLLKIAHDAPQD